MLIVDDDEFVRALLSRLLTDEGFRCTTAAGGAEARARLAHERFGMALVDVMMPGESGLDLVGDLLAQFLDA